MCLGDAAKHSLEKFLPFRPFFFVRIKKNSKKKTEKQGLYWLRATGGFPFNTSLCQQSDSLVYHGAIRRHWEPKSFFRLFFLIFRLDPLVRVCTHTHTHTMSVKKPKQQQTQTHKSPAGSRLSLSIKISKRRRPATTRPALDAQTTKENVLFWVSFDSSNNFNRTGVVPIKQLRLAVQLWIDESIDHHVVLSSRSNQRLMMKNK